MFTEEFKNLPIENNEYATVEIAISDDLSEELNKLAHVLGDGAVYRFDFRIVPLSNGKTVWAPQVRHD